MAGAFYLDSSALVKLAVEEAESRALHRFVADGAERVLSSVLGVAEVGRAARRVGRSADDVIQRLTLLELTRAILDRSVTIEPPSLRTLDAVHLATALSVRGQVDAFVAYDERLVKGARGAGLEVVSPS